MGKIAIIGGGISGITLALRFLEQGINAVVFDNGKPNSSKVAAGLWNPVVFKRLTPSWMVNRLLDELYLFYPKMELLTEGAFFNPMPIYKFINDDNELKMWKLKQNDTELFDITNPELKQIENNQYHQKLGYCQVLKSGFVNIPEYLNCAVNFLKSKNAYINKEINYSEFNRESERIKFEDFDFVIFAEGMRAKENLFFTDIKFNLCKGDVITFKADLQINNAVINNEGFIVPLGNNTYKIGSTYVWDDLSNTPTNEGYNKMIEKIKSLINVPFEVIKHEAGVRPTIIDRKPVLGFHPEIKNVYVFNGMGTKGVLLCPYFSKLATAHILDEATIPMEVSYERFSS